jgi:hypothetical protein
MWHLRDHEGELVVPRTLDGSTKLADFKGQKEAFYRGEFNGPFQEQWRQYFSTEGCGAPMSYPRETIAKKGRVWFSWGCGYSVPSGYYDPPYELYRVYRAVGGAPSPPDPNGSQDDVEPLEEPPPPDSDKWAVLGETTALAWLDTNAIPGWTYSYKACGIDTTGIDWAAYTDGVSGLKTEVMMGAPFSVSVPEREVANLRPTPPPPDEYTVNNGYSYFDHNWSMVADGNNERVLAYLIHDYYSSPFAYVIFDNDPDRYAGLSDFEAEELARSFNPVNTEITGGHVTRCYTPKNEDRPWYIETFIMNTIDRELQVSTSTPLVNMGGGD